MPYLVLSMYQGHFQHHLIQMYQLKDTEHV